MATKTQQLVPETEQKPQIEQQYIIASTSFFVGSCGILITSQDARMRYYDDNQVRLYRIVTENQWSGGES